MRISSRSSTRTSHQNQAPIEQQRHSRRLAGPEIALQLVLGVATIAIGGLCYFNGNTTEGYSIAGIGLLTLYLI